MIEAARRRPGQPLVMSQTTLMAAVGTPAFLTPTDAMTQIGSMFDHGNSVGAALVLLAVGAGLNLGLVAWAWRS